MNAAIDIPQKRYINSRSGHKRRRLVNQVMLAFAGLMALVALIPALLDHHLRDHSRRCGNQSRLFHADAQTIGEHGRWRAACD